MNMMVVTYHDYRLLSNRLVKYKLKANKKYSFVRKQHQKVWSLYIVLFFQGHTYKHSSLILEHMHTFNISHICIWSLTCQEYLLPGVAYLPSRIQFVISWTCLTERTTT